jgi:hypothetical protein
MKAIHIKIRLIVVRLFFHSHQRQHARVRFIMYTFLLTALNSKKRKLQETSFLLLSSLHTMNKLSTKWYLCVQWYRFPVYRGTSSPTHLISQNSPLEELRGMQLLRDPFFEIRRLINVFTKSGQLNPVDASFSSCYMSHPDHLLDVIAITLSTFHVPHSAVFSNLLHSF